MPTFNVAVGDIVVVPFPYADRLAEKRRPALVVSNEQLRNEGFVWVVMITSARHTMQRFDIEIANLAKAGLPVASLIRPTKIACIEPRRILRHIGMLDPKQTSKLLRTIRSFIGRSRAAMAKAARS